MKKMIVLAGCLLASVIACQKDYYLEDLNDALKDIDRLEKLHEQRVNSLQSRIDELNESIGSLSSLNSELSVSLSDTEEKLDIVEKVLDFIKENPFVLLTQVEIKSLYKKGDVIYGWTIQDFYKNNSCGAFHDDNPGVAHTNSPRYSDHFNKWWANNDCSSTVEDFGNIHMTKGDDNMWIHFGMYDRIGKIQKIINEELYTWGQRINSEKYGGGIYNAYPEDPQAYYWFEIGTLPVEYVFDAFTR